MKHLTVRDPYRFLLVKERLIYICTQPPSQMGKAKRQSLRALRFQKTVLVWWHVPLVAYSEAFREGVG
jgi:hypothetical protein